MIFVVIICNSIQIKHLNIQLEASKSSNEDFFRELLNEMKGFKYKITVKVLLNKY